MAIAEKINLIQSEIIPYKATLVAISKTKSVEEILEAYNARQRIFGENKVQELEVKYRALPKDIEWHMVGHLQSNKIKYIAPFISLIHSVDSFKLLQAINKTGQKSNRVLPCLLQIYIAQEETKYGFDIAEVKQMLKSIAFRNLTHIEIRGLMGIATNTENEEQVKQEFTLLKQTFRELKEQFFKDHSTFSEISMGMTHDYKLALECGSTMVRIGSAIFGERNYGATT